MPHLVHRRLRRKKLSTKVRKSCLETEEGFVASEDLSTAMQCLCVDSELKIVPARLPPQADRECEHDVEIKHSVSQVIHEPNRHEQRVMDGWTNSLRNLCLSHGDKKKNTTIKV